MYRMSKLLMAAVVVIVSANPVFALTRDTSTRAVGSACLEQAGSTANLDRVRLPDMRSNFTNEGSLLMWVKLRSNMTSTTTGKGGLSEFGTAPYGTSYPYIDGSVLIGELSTARPSLGTLSGVDKTVWHQLAMTIDSSGTYKIYQNGTLSHTAAGQRFSLSAEPLLGGDSDATIHLDGWMDDVQLYSTALSGTDISELYASPGSTKTGLVGRWDFEDAGRPWDDSSGNGHHGISDVPAEIAPIHAPFEMPQLKRPVFADRTFNIVDYGAKGDGTTKNTTAFGEAIAACHKAGGGKVLVPAGKWLTGAIHLKSHVNLHMEKDAEIHFSDDPQDYLPVVFTRWAGYEVMNYSPLIYANGCENIAVTGPGKLYGHGKKWWGWFKRETPTMLEALVDRPVEERIFGSPELGLRPEFINPVNCRNVLLEGFTVAGGGPFWTIQFLYCENVIARKLTIHTLGGPNGDGINLDSTRNALVEHCFLNTEDDAIAIKSGINEDGRRVGKPSENIVVRHCYSKGTGWGGLAVGSEMSGDVRNVFVEDVTFDRTKLGIFLKSNRQRGGIVENLTFKNIRLHNIGYDALLLMTDYAAHGPAAKDATHYPTFRNITFKDISCEGAGQAIAMNGISHLPIKNVRMEDVFFKNVDNGADFCRIKELTLDNVNIDSKGRPIDLEDVSEVSIKNVELTGEKPLRPIQIRGAKSGAIRIEGLDPDKVECASDVPQNGIQILNSKDS